MHVNTVFLTHHAEHRQLRREVCLHAELSHPNLNALVGAWLFDGHLHVVLHRCVGDLREQGTRDTRRRTGERLHERTRARAPTRPPNRGSSRKTTG